jgi:hypothetical protein
MPTWDFPNSRITPATVGADVATLTTAGGDAFKPATAGDFVVAASGGSKGIDCTAFYSAVVVDLPMTDLNQRIYVTWKLDGSISGGFGAVLRDQGSSGGVPSTGLTIKYHGDDTWSLGNGVGFDFDTGNDSEGTALVFDGRSVEIEYRLTGAASAAQFAEVLIAGVRYFYKQVNSSYLHNTVGRTGWCVDLPGDPVLVLAAYAESIPTTPTGYSLTGPGEMLSGEISPLPGRDINSTDFWTITLTPSGATAASDITFTAAGDLTLPSPVVIPAGDAAVRFRAQMPASAADGATKTLALTNDASLTNPAAVSVLATRRGIVIGINSIGEYLNGDAGSFPVLLRGRLRGASDIGFVKPAIVNVAQTGISTPTLRTRLQNEVFNRWASAVPSDVRVGLVVWEAGNHLTSLFDEADALLTGTVSSNAQTMATAYASILADFRTAFPAPKGFAVAAIPYEWAAWQTSANRLAVFRAFAQLIRAAHADWDGILDLAGDAWWTTTGSDGLHLTVDGAAAMAALVWPEFARHLFTTSAGWYGAGGGTSGEIDDVDAQEVADLVLAGILDSDIGAAATAIVNAKYRSGTVSAGASTTGFTLTGTGFNTTTANAYATKRGKFRTGALKDSEFTITSNTTGLAFVVPTLIGTPSAGDIVDIFV